jgi:hypothetical protein
MQLALRMTIRRGIVTCAAMLVAGCAGHDDGETTGTAAAQYAEADRVTATLEGSRPAPPVDIYVAVEGCSAQAGEKCVGGSTVRQINTTTTWLVTLDLSSLDDAAIEQANGGGTALIFLGQLGMRGPTGLATFTVEDAWRGLPDVEPPAGDAVVTIASKDGVLAAEPVDGTGESRLETASLTDFAPELVDPAWLTTRVLDHGALVAATIEGATLHADQIYVHLPDVAGPCRLPWRAQCGEGERATVRRDADRCFAPTGCVHPGGCPLYQPVCLPGYSLSAWPSLPEGCPVFVCDPAFLGP